MFFLYYVLCSHCCLSFLSYSLYLLRWTTCPDNEAAISFRFLLLQERLLVWGLAICCRFAWTKRLRTSGHRYMCCLFTSGQVRMSNFAFSHSLVFKIIHRLGFFSVATLAERRTYLKWLKITSHGSQYLFRKYKPPGLDGRTSAQSQAWWW